MKLMFKLYHYCWLLLWFLPL